MVVVSVLLALCAASPVESGAFALLVATAIGGLVCVIVLIGAVRELAAEVRRAREDAARLRALVGGFGDMVLTFHLDADGRFTDVSPSARALLGIAPGDLIGQRYADTLHADAVEDATGPVREATFVHPDGGTRTLMLATRLDTWTGATEGIAFDVTSTKAAMVALRRSDERFRSAFEEAGVGLGELDLLGRWTRLNPRLAEILRADTAESRSLHDLTHPDDNAPLDRALADLAEGRTDHATLEVRVARPPDAWAWVELRLAIAGAADGEPERLVAVVEDIDRRRRAEIDKDRREAELAAIRRAHQAFLCGERDRKVLFKDLLDALLGVREICCGLLCELRRDGDEGALVTIAQHSHEDGPVCPLGQAVGTPTATVIARLASGAQTRLDEGEISAILGAETAKNVGALLALPIRQNDRLVGVMLMSPQPGEDDDALLAAAQPVLTTCGQLIAALQGIEARDHALAELRRSEAAARRLARIVGECESIVCILDGERRMKWFNEAFARLVGYDLAELRGKDPEVVLRLLGDPADPERARAAASAYASGRTYQTEIAIHARDGSPRRLALASQRVPDPESGEVETLILGLDVTATRAAEEQLRESEARLRAIGDSLPGCAIRQVIFDGEEGRHLYVSAGASRLWGVDVGVGDPVRTLLARCSPEAMTRLDSEHLRQRLADEPIVAEIPLAIDGRTRWVRLHAAPRALEGGVTIWDCVDLDVTDRRELEAELRRARHAAEAASEAKSHFIANISHELRTPLGGILGMSELLLDDHLAPGLRRRLEIVRRSSEWLLHLVNDLLDFSRIEAGHLELVPAPFDLHREVCESLRSLGARARARGLRLQCELDPDLPRMLVGDEGRVRQILINLVGNAIKFTEHGEVSVRAERVGDDDHHADILLEVRDTGIGIPADRLTQIFEPFEQADASTTRRFGGTGLGLAICSRLIAEMGGEIEVESQLGQGSTFRARLRLPRAHVDDGATLEREEIAKLQHRRPRVLIVDGRSAATAPLRILLRRWGVDASDLDLDLEIDAEALGRRTSAIDVAIVDTSGAASSAVVDAIRRAAPALPLLVVEDAGASSRERDLDASTTTVIAPYTPAELRSALLAALFEQPILRPHPPAQTPSRRLRILVVEDDPVNRTVIAEMLARGAHTTELVTNGREALAILANRRFDVILMDLQMPELDGLQTTAAIRASEPPGEHVPIIALTARAMPGDRQICRDAGMDGYVTKPPRLTDLEAAIRQVTVRGVGDAPPSPAAPQPPAAPDPDVRELLESLGGRRDVLLRLIGIFQRTLPDVVDDLRAAIANRDAEALQSHAHRLAGMVSHFHARRALAAARRVEQAARSGALDDACDAAPELLQELDEAAVALAALAISSSP